ncbi:MAG: bifunctional glutamate N-acetyltransferase/amino-acid acetyltransferase ArgJ [Thermodesulfobacteriaceae bacterium]|nr:bifunctional glutamate N-acetyltransferase/amino-acid acetyltransferase ArgJ [Thermodesulfobacteriaceae bacterium]MCX8041187.1 bifunctional glutamate N-acetyltransferase/amino-acid acetyltransferase ArgJ [Thermodesulfobacteriaceae bacterium]MDW8135175.1 bifunctional glutamate N-acetyltransferase/amino-acid acetyltransferase ArgJ [Thermodesulfobacterium sp.]
MLVPEGFLFSAVSCGIKKEGKLDLGLIFCNAEGTSWGVFTKNVVKAAPVILGKKLIKEPITKGILVNSGVANACTGEEGLKRAQKLLSETSKFLGISEKQLLPASTGIIGDQLPLEKILPKIPELIANLSSENPLLFSQAIMTTDTFPKIVSKETKEGIRILGIAKGAGMIAPNMATMLAFILTDGEVPKNQFKKLLPKIVDQSFNTITVDGDMSTNDTVYILSSNLKNIKNWKNFENLCLEVAKELAHLIVRDGEGASKIIKIKIKGSKSKKEAKKLAQAVANSPLVKTAFYGEDPNWGRILAALGKTEVRFDPEKVEIYLNGIPWIKNFKVINKESVIKEEMKKYKLELLVKLKMGKVSYELVTCDLTEEYIKINAQYRS